MTDPATMMTPVTVKHSKTGAMGPGWYAWETEYPEEGFFYFNETVEPTEDMIKQICPNFYIDD